VCIFVVGVTGFNVTLHPVDGQVHLAEPHSGIHLFLPVNGEDTTVPVLMTLSEFLALNKHTAGTTGRVEHLAVERLQHLYNQLYNGGRREELTAFLPLTHREVTQKIFINFPEHIATHSDGDIRKCLQQILQRFILKPFVLLGQHIGQLRVGFLDRLHRFIDRIADILILRQNQEPFIPCFLRYVHHTFGLVVIRSNGTPSGGLFRELLMNRHKPAPGIPQKD